MNPWARVSLLFVLVVLALGALGLSFLTLSSFLTLYAPVAVWWWGIGTALFVDLLWLTGFFTTLAGGGVPSRVTFYGALGVSVVSSGFTGFVVAGPIGMCVAVIPAIGMVLVETVWSRMVFGIRVVPTSNHKPTRNQRPTKTTGSTTTNQKPTTTNQDLVAIVNQLRARGETPGRSRIAQEFGLNQPDSREVARLLKENSNV